VDRTGTVSNVTVGHAIWPDQLAPDELAQLDPGLPRDVNHHPDILVVGGGILGVATALACQQAGLGSVTLLEREQLGAGASGGAAGQLIPEAHVGVDPTVLVELGRLSLTAWRELERTLPHGVGLIDLDWLGIQESAEQFGAAGLPPSAERLDAAHVNRLVPGLSQSTEGVYVRHQARVNPLRAIARMAAGLPSVATGVAVQRVSVAGARVQTVGTSAGEFTPGAVIFATGTPPRLDGLDLHLPASEVKGHMLVSEPTSLTLPGSVAPLATTMEDGRLLRGGTLDVGDDERVVRPEVIAAMWAEVEAAWPIARRIRVEYQWACFRPAHPDHLPVIDRVPGLDNAWLTSGHYKTGILMAPATGRALAKWLQTGQPPAEIQGLEATRFGVALARDAS
jgi:glycine oxidase